MCEGAAQSGFMHPAIRLLEQSFAIEGGGTLQISAVGVRARYYGRGRPKRYWPTGHLLAHQDYGLFTGQKHGVQATPGR